MNISDQTDGDRRTAVVIGIVLLCGGILGHAARWFADGMAVNAQLYFHAFRIDNLRSPWVLAPLRFLSAAVLQYSALASWAFACGYFCARTAARRAAACVGAFTAVALLATAFTTTSVRIAQPRFFESAVASTLYPLAVKLLFVVVPACLAARAVRRRSTSALAVSIVAGVAVVLAWWTSSDLGHALTFGCVLRTGAATSYCASPERSWGAWSAGLLALAAVLMAWDALKTNAARSGSCSTLMRRIR